MDFDGYPNLVRGKYSKSILIRNVHTNTHLTNKLSKMNKSTIRFKFGVGWVSVWGRIYLALIWHSPGINLESRWDRSGSMWDQIVIIWDQPEINLLPSLG